MVNIQKKALYNLLRMTHSLEDGQVALAPNQQWKVEDQREVSTEELFERLKPFGIFLSKPDFLAVSENFDTPEELFLAFVEEREPSEQEDHLFLILFELWRRLLPTRFSFSLFFDELDRVIFSLDQGDKKAFFALQGLLAELQSHLSELREGEKNPQKIFQELSFYSAHNLESFLYDFILDQLKEDHLVFASELLDGFEDYISDGKAFLLLKARLFSENEKEHAIKVVTKLLQKKEAKGDLSFLIEVLDFSIDIGSTFLFYLAFEMLTPLLKEEGEFQEVLTLGAKLFCLLDDEKKEALLEEILEKRENKKENAPFSLQDPDFLKIKPLFFDPSKKF